MGLRFGEWGGADIEPAEALKQQQHRLVLSAAHPHLVRHASCSPKPKRLCTSKCTYIDYRLDLFILVDRTT